MDKFTLYSYQGETGLDFGSNVIVLWGIDGLNFSQCSRVIINIMCR